MGVSSQCDMAFMSLISCVFYALTVMSVCHAYCNRFSFELRVGVATWKSCHQLVTLNLCHYRVVTSSPVTYLLTSQKTGCDVILHVVAWKSSHELFFIVCLWVHTKVYFWIFIEMYLCINVWEKKMGLIFE